jgi:Na+/melibiose symporter-like transporter
VGTADVPRRTQLGVLHNSDFLLLWNAGVISLIGDWALGIGLAFYVYILTSSTLATGGLVLASLLPQAIVGSFAGVFVDRWPRKTTMVVSNLVMAGGLVPLFFVHSEHQLWIIYAVAVAESAVGAFFSPAEGALIPDIVEPDALLQANSVYGVGKQLARFVGAAVGGVTVGVYGLEGAASVDLVSFVAAAAILLPIVENRQAVAQRISAVGSRLLTDVRRFGGELWEGLSVSIRSRAALTMLVFVAITGVGEGIFAALGPAFVVTVLRGTGADYGLFNSLQAVGGIVGGFYASSRARVWNAANVLSVTSILFGALDLVLFNYHLFYPTIAPAFVLRVVIGLPAAAVGATFAALQQTAVASRYRGRYLSTAQTIGLLCMATGSVVGGALGRPVGIIPLLEIMGSVYVAGGLIVAVGYRTGPWGRAPDQVGDKAHGTSGGTPRF